MCFGVEPKAKYYYHEEISPSRPSRAGAVSASASASGGDYYYHHHHRHSSHSSSHSPRGSRTAVERYSPRVSTSSYRRSVPVPTRVVYTEATRSRYH
ncbi:hypothetical protein V8C35DRAFT_293565, partial [Trichoderma chlorosporum]